jgi:hypothetical protein
VATSPPSTSSFDANSRDGQPDASLGTFKRPHRAAGVKAEPFTYASACRVPEGGQGSARAGRPGGACRRRIRLQDSPARSSACTRGAATWVFDAGGRQRTSSCVALLAETGRDDTALC